MISILRQKYSTMGLPDHLNGTASLKTFDQAPDEAQRNPPNLKVWQPTKESLRLQLKEFCQRKNFNKLVYKIPIIEGQKLKNTFSYNSFCKFLVIFTLTNRF